MVINIYTLSNVSYFMHMQSYLPFIITILNQSYSLEIGTMQQGIFSYCWDQSGNNITDNKYGSISQHIFAIV